MPLLRPRSPVAALTTAAAGAVISPGASSSGAAGARARIAAGGSFRALRSRSGHVIGRLRPRQIASSQLACCDMRTLYLRNVPDDVVERLERLAARDATSVSAVAIRELAEVSRRADNPALLGALPDLGIDTPTIVQDLDAERASR